jgi:CheY-like chemotaxis protein
VLRARDSDMSAALDLDELQLPLVGPVGTSPRLLIMDADFDSRGVLSRALSELGYSVSFAPNATEAVRRFETARSVRRPYAAVVVADAKSDGVVAFSTLVRLRRIDQGVRVIAATSRPRGSYTDLGFTAVLARPYCLLELSAALQKVVPLPENPKRSTRRPPPPPSSRKDGPTSGVIRRA